ncbi:uncharacterized protein [Diadema antillarum]|uniref:uncharacterized protein n=1 Tax=Diadema antillarum TaxID=105358 RepID=UPI003A841DDD
MGYQWTSAIVTVCLMTNFAEIDCQIPDDVVVVGGHSILLRGLPGKLKCQFSVEPEAVQWVKEPTPNSVTLLVSLHGDVVGGSSYRSGEMTIDSNYSLNIHTVINENAGRYCCRVAYNKNNLIQNCTDVYVTGLADGTKNVFALNFIPDPDFLTVTECSSSDCSLSYDPERTALQCQAVNVQQELINIYWLPSGVNQKQHIVTVSNNDGTQNIYANVTLTPDLTGTFACVAEIKSTHSEVKRISVTIPTPIPISAVAVESTKSPINQPKGISIGLGVGVFFAIVVIAIVVIAVLIGIFYWHRTKGPISYIELWEMSNQTNNNKLTSTLRQFLIDKNELDTDCQFVLPPEDIYNGLCRWKEKTKEGRQWTQLSTYNSTLQEQMEEYRQKYCELSHDDISHVLWCVSKQPQQVKTLLKQLDIKTQVDLEAGNVRTLVENLMIEWAGSYQQSSVGTETTRYVRVEGGIKLPEMAAKGGKPFNVKVAFCLAVEKAGCTEEAKTFFRISEKNKRPLDKEYIETIALAITKRHCRSLGGKVGINEKDIDVRNKDNLEWLFRTDKLLEDWVSNQECSNYEKRCRLREATASKLCDRQDVAGTTDSTADGKNVKTEPAEEKQPTQILSGESSEPTEKEENAANEKEEDKTSEKTPLIATIKNEETEETEETSGSKDCDAGQNESTDKLDGENGSAAVEAQTANEKTEYNDGNTGLQRRGQGQKVVNGEKDVKPVQTMPESEGHKTGPNGTKPGSEQIKKEEDKNEAISSITIEEIKLIRKYGDSEALQSIAQEFKLDIPKSVDDNDMIQALENVEDEGKKEGKRWKIRRVLRKMNPTYEELLAEKRYNAPFKAEIPRLAMRLLMTDVYPFAQALGYSTHRLSQFQVNHSLEGSNNGTTEVIRQRYRQQKTSTDETRTVITKLLRKCGYRQIARTFYFDFDVSTSDLMAVATRIEPAVLARKLGVEHPIESQTRTGDKIQDNMKMLTEWRKMMCPPDCNHRTTLADLMYDARHKPVAMGILTGQYRDCVPSVEVLTELARHIPASEADRLRKILEVNTEQSDPQSDNYVLELLVEWVEQGKENFLNLLKKQLGPESERGIKHGKVTQLTNSSSPTEQQIA